MCLLMPLCVQNTSCSENPLHSLPLHVVDLQDLTRLIIPTILPRLRLRLVEQQHKWRSDERKNHSMWMLHAWVSIYICGRGNVGRDHAGCVSQLCPLVHHHDHLGYHDLLKNCCAFRAGVRRVRPVAIYFYCNGCRRQGRCHSPNSIPNIERRRSHFRSLCSDLAREPGLQCSYRGQWVTNVARFKCNANCVRLISDVANLAYLASLGITLTNYYAITHPSQVRSIKFGEMFPSRSHWRRSLTMWPLLVVAPSGSLTTVLTTSLPAPRQSWISWKRLASAGVCIKRTCLTLALKQIIPTKKPVQMTTCASTSEATNTQNCVRAQSD